jgi:hypothetical protein
MKDSIRFTAVGENIHCTRCYKAGGRYVRGQAGGGWAVVADDAGEELLLPVPGSFLEAGGEVPGKVRHVAVAIYLGLSGNDAERALGRRYLAVLARRQEECGASYLDLNVDEFSSDPGARREAMEFAARVVQEASPLPLSIDSSTVELLACGLAACDPARGRPLVNSISLEREEALEMAAQAGAAVIAGAGGRQSLPSNCEERLANTEILMKKLAAAGLDQARIFLDPLVMPASVNPEHGKIVLDAIGELRRRYGPEARFAPGLSNISFGMPRRRLLNLVFTDLCILKGADGGIVDPLQINPRTLTALDRESEPYRLARDFLGGADSFGMNFISAVREQRI